MQSRLSEPAEKILAKLEGSLRSLTPMESWHKLTQTELSPEQDFSVHLELYNYIYREQDPELAPGPAWVPSKAIIDNSNLKPLMRRINTQSYDELHAWTVENFQEFWKYALEEINIKFAERYLYIYDADAPVEKPNWLGAAKLNIVESCLQSEGHLPAIVYQNFAKEIKTLNYAELGKMVNQVANSLVLLGLEPGSSIAIDMLFTVETVAIYLGIVKAGFVAVGIAESFATEEIATRLRLSNAKLIFCHDVITRGEKNHPLYAKVQEANLARAVVLPINNKEIQVELAKNDLAWSDFLSKNQEFTAVMTEPHDFITILFSSGTTGEPKAIPWDNCSAIKAAVDGYFHQDIHPKDVVAWPTSLGWMMGPWLIYATLINKGTLAISYNLPTSVDFIQFVQDAKVNVLGLVPSLVKTWRKQELVKGYDWSQIKLFSSSGEASNFQDMLWLMSRANYKPVIEYCGGTEISGAYISSTVVQPNIPSTFSTPTLGLDLVLFDHSGKECSKGEVGIIPPSIGLSRELLNRDHYQVYFAGMPASAAGKTLRRHGDELQRLSNGYYRSLGRADDTMNLGGIKVSSAEIERVLLAVPGIVETAAVAMDDGGPSKLVIFIVAKEPASFDSAKYIELLQAEINQHLNPLFKIERLELISSLPRTSSNKIMRRVLRDQLS